MIDCEQTRRARTDGNRGELGVRESRGFTLAELLIVVAIIGVLVAIAIPVFSASLASAQEATCLANRTSLYHEATASFLTGEYDSVEKAVTEIYAQKKSVYTCPLNGTFYYDETDKEVKCREHSGRKLFTSAVKLDVAQDMLEVFESFFGTLTEVPSSVIEAKSTNPYISLPNMANDNRLVTYNGEKMTVIAALQKEFGFSDDMREYILNTDNKGISSAKLYLNTDQKTVCGMVYKEGSNWIFVTEAGTYSVPNSTASSPSAQWDFLQDPEKLALSGTKVE